MKAIYLILVALWSSASFAGPRHVEPSPAEYPWGPVSGGLAARIWAADHRFKVGQSIEIWFAEKNQGQVPVRIWGTTSFWPTHRLVVLDERGNSAEFTALGLERKKRFSPGGERQAAFPGLLEPGTEHFHIKINVGENFTLSRPGLYSIQMLYEDSLDPVKTLPGWKGKCWSNLLLFEIR